MLIRIIARVTDFLNGVTHTSQIQLSRLCWHHLDFWNGHRVCVDNIRFRLIETALSRVVSHEQKENRIGKQQVAMAQEILDHTARTAVPCFHHLDADKTFAQGGPAQKAAANEQVNDRNQEHDQ